MTLTFFTPPTTNALKQGVVLGLALCPALAAAQALPADVGSSPAGVGFSLPTVSGSLQYAVSASELISTGFYSSSGSTETTNLSGDLAYLSKSSRPPFSAVYSGGLLLANSGQPTTFYQSLAFSQSFSTKKWNFNVTDGVSYLPENPSTGLSGVPGVGDLGIDPIPVGPAAGLGILTSYGPRVSNTVTVGVSRAITARLAAQASGYYGIQRFIGDNSSLGLDSNTEGGSAGFTYRLSARQALTGNYNYSNFGFSNSPVSFQVQSGTLGYSRQWNRRFTTSVYAGPQVENVSDPALGSNSVNVTAGASASYLTRLFAYTLNYSRGVNNGSGVIPGGFSDNVVFGVHRQFGRTWDLSGTASYSRTRGLPALSFLSYSSDSVAASGQATRALARHLAAYGSYTLEDQTVSSNAAAYNAFNGFYQVIGLGITFSPSSISLGR